MANALWTWAASAVVLTLAAILIGLRRQGRWYGMITDSRGRCSLSQLQLVLWTVILFSLFAGIFVGRLRAGVASPLEFDIPGEVLALTGITVTSAVLATTVKEAKNSDRDAQSRLAAAVPTEPATSANRGTGTRFSQVFLVEEGAGADQVVDVTKFQNFWLTLLLAVGYVSAAVAAISGASSAADLAVPQLGTTFITLLGISHAGYIAAKMPARAGNVEERGRTISLANRDEHRLTVNSR